MNYTFIWLWLFSCITEKYMEFDLNDKGEIGNTAPVLQPYNIFSYRAKLLLCVLTLIKDLLTNYCTFFYLFYFSELSFCSFFLDIMGLKRMLEKLGLAKTHLELKKMMSEVVGGTSKETINYNDFLNMMLGKRNAILKLWVWNTMYGPVSFQTKGGHPKLFHMQIRIKGRYRQIPNLLFDWKCLFMVMLTALIKIRKEKKEKLTTKHTSIFEKQKMLM